jgi:hypothetical protein
MLHQHSVLCVACLFLYVPCPGCYYIQFDKHSSCVLIGRSLPYIYDTVKTICTKPAPKEAPPASACLPDT